MATVIDEGIDEGKMGRLPNQFDMFTVSAGPLPRETSLALPAQQFHSDGHTGNFNESAVANQAEPQHPAPVLILDSESSATAGSTQSDASVGGSRASPW